MEKAPPHGPPGRDRQQPLLTKQIDIASEGCGVHDENFRDFTDGNRLILGDGGEDRELGGANARILQGVVKECGHGPGSATEVKRGAGAGAGEVEVWKRRGHYALDLYLQLKI